MDKLIDTIYLKQDKMMSTVEEKIKISMVKLMESIKSDNEAIIVKIATNVAMQMMGAMKEMFAGKLPTNSFATATVTQKRY